MEKTTVGEGRFSLMIRGEALQKQELAEKLSLTATGLIRKGELLSRVPRIEATEDVWVYEIPLTDPEGEDTALNALLETLLARLEPFGGADPALPGGTPPLRSLQSGAYYLSPNAANAAKTHGNWPSAGTFQPELGRIRLVKNSTFPRIRSMNYDGIVKKITHSSSCLVAFKDGAFLSIRHAEGAQLNAGRRAVDRRSRKTCRRKNQGTGPCVTPSPADAERRRAFHLRVTAEASIRLCGVLFNTLPVIE